MPHSKIAIVSTIHAANQALWDAQQGAIGGAATLSDLAVAIGLSDADQETIGRLYPETQEVILQSVKIAAAAGRRPYLTWRHSMIQRLEITVPSPDQADLPMDIAVHSRYVGDRPGTGQNGPA